MQELLVQEQMEVQGGSVAVYVLYVAVFCALYKIICSSSGRVSIPYFVTLEWN